MTNSRKPSGVERKEPQLSPMTNLDKLREESRKPIIGDLSDSAQGAATGSLGSSVEITRANARSSSAQGPTSSKGNGGLWAVLFLLVLALGGLSAFGYMELERVNGMQRVMLERVNILAAESDQFSSKLSVSGGQLEQTQSSINARVSELEKTVLAQIKVVNEAAKQDQTLAANLKQQINAAIEKQSKSFNALSGSVTTDLTAVVDQKLGVVTKENIGQAKALKALEKQVAQASAAVDQQRVGFNQALQLMKEELSSQPNSQVEKLQDQFATYMQSVDQFRQQTNASLNELNLQLQGAYRGNQSQGGGGNSGFEQADQGFGVQPVN